MRWNWSCFWFVPVPQAEKLLEQPGWQFIPSGLERGIRHRKITHPIPFTGTAKFTVMAFSENISFFGKSPAVRAACGIYCLSVFVFLGA